MQCVGRAGGAFSAAAHDKPWRHKRAILHSRPQSQDDGGIARRRSHAAAARVRRRSLQSFRQGLPAGLVGLVFTEISEGLLRGELELRKALLAPNGYLHAGAVVTFAD